MKRNISEDPEVNKANFFKTKTTKELEKSLKIFIARDSGMLAKDYQEEIDRRKNKSKTTI